MGLAAAGRGPAEDQENVMRALGYVTAVVMAAAGAVLGVLAVKAVPGGRRYRPMRKR